MLYHRAYGSFPFVAIFSLCVGPDHTGRHLGTQGRGVFMSWLAGIPCSLRGPLMRRRLYPPAVIQMALGGGHNTFGEMRYLRNEERVKECVYVCVCAWKKKKKERTSIFYHPPKNANATKKEMQMQRIFLFSCFVEEFILFNQKCEMSFLTSGVGGQ